MRFDTAIEVTTSQPRIELMFPADDAAKAYFRTHQLDLIACLVAAISLG